MELLPLVLSMYTSEKSLVTSSLYSSAAYLSSRRKRLRFPLSLLFPSQCKSHSLDLLAALLLNAEGVTLVFLSSKDVLLTVVEFPVNQKPHGFSHRGATCVGSFKPILLHGVTLSQVQDFAFLLLSFKMFVDLFLQLIQLALNCSPTYWLLTSPSSLCHS